MSWKAYQHQRYDDAGLIDCTSSCGALESAGGDDSAGAWGSRSWSSGMSMEGAASE